MGATYAANTLGGIAGSIAGGFGLIPWLSAPGVWRLVVALLLGLAGADKLEGLGGNDNIDGGDGNDLTLTVVP